MTKSYVTSLMLNEQYVTEVLGFDSYSLNESKYSISINQAILAEHLLLENWISQGLGFLKDKAKDAYDFAKDKAMEVPNAIKEFGSNTKGVVTALVAMMKDPEEFKLYKRGLQDKISTWTTGLGGNFTKMAGWFENRGLKKIADFCIKIKDFLNDVNAGSTKQKGWKGVIAGLVVGLLSRYLEEEFELSDKVETASQILDNPMDVLKDFIKNKIAGDDEDEDGKDDAEDNEYVAKIKEFFQGKLDDTADFLKDTEFVKKLTAFFEEKLGFIAKVKEKIEETIKSAAGKAIESLAGPIAWIKQLVELFGKADWVTSNLSDFLQKYEVPALLQRN